MANVKVKVVGGVVNNNPVGSEISVAESDYKWLSERGYVEKVEEKPKAKPKKKEESDEEKDSDKE